MEGVGTSGLLSWGAPPPSTSFPSETALRLLEAASKAFPERQDLRLELVRHLFRMRRPQAVIAAARSSLQSSPVDPELLTCLGQAAAVVGDAPLALQAYTAAAGRGAEVSSDLAQALHRTGRSDEALALGIKRLDAEPNDFSALSLVTRILLGREERQRVWRLCEDLRRRGAWGGYVPSAMAHAATTSAQRDLVCELMDLNVWLKEDELPCEPELLQELAADLQQHAQARPLPLTTSTRGQGVRIDDFEQAPGTTGEPVLRAAMQAVEAYVTERLGFDQHPMIAHRSGFARLRAWALSVRNDGHEDWHAHPDGWVSGVLYLEVPATAPESHRRDDARYGCPGAIQFGPLPLGQKTQPDYLERRTLSPSPGKILLFPSYLGHRTWPTHASARRTCVAFDVLSA